MSGQGITSSTEERALRLLGSGIGPEQVAAALGVSVSRISQLLSTPEFMSQVADLRFQNLSKHNERDSQYDAMEDDLIERLRDCLPLMIRPLEILRAIQIINAAKRRGTSTPEHISNQQTVVNLVMPVQIINKFTTNINNQVIEAGTSDQSQKLVTIQSGTLMDKIKAAKNAGVLEGDTYEPQRRIGNRETVVTDL